MNTNKKCNQCEHLKMEEKNSSYFLKCNNECNKQGEKEICPFCRSLYFRETPIPDRLCCTKCKGFFWSRKNNIKKEKSISFTLSQLLDFIEEISYSKEDIRIDYEVCNIYTIDSGVIIDEFNKRI